VIINLHGDFSDIITENPNAKRNRQSVVSLVQKLH